MSFWSAPRILSGAAPVFLVGFVRSGTTWLDQILSSHPDIAVMEEHDHFVDASRDLVIADGELDRIGALSDAQINAYRNAYWRRAEAVLKDDIARPLIIDKAPLNTAQLPLIARLFPEARIIFALRDPRDCVMSAFQQYFQLNVGMAYFLDMQTSAVFYDKVMTIGELTRRKSNLVFHEVRYERVVENFDAEVAAVLNFLGVEWDDSVRDYRETAKRRAVNTPSLRQVIQKPYATSIGKWRNYRDGMASALPVLAPWVEKFGYDAD